MYRKVKAVGLPAMVIKLADRMANVRNCVEHNDKGLLEMYSKEHLTFMSHLYTKDMNPIWAKLVQMVGVP